MRLFGSERLMGIFNALGVAEGEQIEHKMLSDAIRKAQERIENNNYGIRENLLHYDQVNNEQREVIYAERNRVLNGENMRYTIISMINEIVENTVNLTCADDTPTEQWDVLALNEHLLPVIPLQPIRIDENTKKPELIHRLKEEAIKLYETKEAQFPTSEHVRETERIILLKVVDNKWMNHIDDMEQLRQNIGVVAYGQRDPLVEYKIQAFDMFEQMEAGIEEDTVRILYHIQVERKLEREPAAKVTGTNKDDSAVRQPVKKSAAKVYPNDPCPCGSGKKYKNCHGRA